jgi:hypothetical protein
MNESMEEYPGRFQSCNHFTITTLTVPSAFPALGFWDGYRSRIVIRKSNCYLICMRVGC